MKLLDKIHICGVDYKVVYETESWLDAAQAWGLADFSKQVITIDARCGKNRQRLTLLHEIIEVINNNQEMGLEHRTISALEAALFQVLEDNKLWRK